MKRWQADLTLVFVALIWGSTFVIVQNALDDVAPMTFVAWRFALAGYTGDTATLLNVSISDRKNVESGKVITKLAQVTAVEAADFAADTAGVRTAAAAALGYALYLWAELTGLPPKLTHEVVGVFREHWAYSSARAERELGYRPTPLREGLRRTVEWLRA